MELTKEYLNWLFDYDQERGVLIWKNHWVRHVVSRLRGKTVGCTYCVLNVSYVNTQINGVTYPVHALIYFLETNTWPEQIDHIDGNGLNNHVSNLRAANTRINQGNRRHHRNGRLVGASWSKEKNCWHGQISLDYNTYNLGYYDTEQDAHNAYLAALTSFNVDNTIKEKRNRFKQHTTILKQARGTSFHRHSNSWRARTKINGKEKCLGYFKTELEAHQRYMDHRRECGAL